MVTAAQFTQARTRPGAQRVAPVPADVLESAQRPVVAADDQYRVRAATVFEIVARFGDVVHRARDLPHLRPHPLHFELCKRGGVVPLGGHQGRTLWRRADRILEPSIARCVGGHRSTPVASVTVLHWTTVAVGWAGKGVIVFDLKITGGTVVDGTGADRFEADVAVKDGRIVEVRRRGPGSPPLEGEAAETIDATGKIVAPGFVDIHTHYDGQVSWDDMLEPSSSHGVTTVVTGNCGVGFAPVRPGTEDWLIGLMEGVEDIPGSALTEGISWGWESYPEYLDAIGRKNFAVDVGSQVAHGAVRAYAMGERGARNEPASPDDIAAMARLVQEAVEAGALGFSTSRTIGHRAIDGEPVPGTYAAEDELFGLGRAMAAGGQAVFELAPQGVAGEDIIAPKKELDWMQRLGAEIDRPISFGMIQVDAAPELWREQLDISAAAHAAGSRLYPQIAARPFGMLFGFPGHHAFTHRPTFRRLKAECSREELAQRLADPAVKAAILSEDDLPPDPNLLFDNMFALVQYSLGRLYALGDPPDYEPTDERTVEKIAAERGEDPLATLYDLMLESDATSMLMLPFYNYSHGNHDAIREMLTHPRAWSGCPTAARTAA